MTDAPRLPRLAAFNQAGDRLEGPRQGEFVLPVVKINTQRLSARLAADSIGAAAAAFERLAAALRSMPPPQIQRHIFKPGGYIAGASATAFIIDELDHLKESPVELRRQRLEAAAERRRSAGLRNSGGFDKKGRRR